MPIVRIGTVPCAKAAYERRLNSYGIIIKNQGVPVLPENKEYSVVLPLGAILDKEASSEVALKTIKAGVAVTLLCSYSIEFKRLTVNKDKYIKLRINPAITHLTKTIVYDDMILPDEGIVIPSAMVTFKNDVKVEDINNNLFELFIID